MTANSLTLHQATKADLGTIERLLEQSWAVHTRLLVADIGLIYLGERLFRRETILTRWK
ncbi:MAG: hypothetical protein GYA80_07920 [Chloroflexi bacterium]|nr:hypothetical protein [Chloroflexota bacterium]